MNVVHKGENKTNEYISKGLRSEIYTDEMWLI